MVPTKGKKTRSTTPDALPATSTFEHEINPTSTEDTPIDLTPQLQNLLLARPFFQLELSKNKYADSENQSLFEGIDTHYLGLAALTYMMEGTAVALGYTINEVQEYLVRILTRTNPQSTPAQRNRIAQIIMDALDNAPNNYQQHTFQYYDASSQRLLNARFRLTSYEPDMEDTYRYKPTAEGYMLLMGMLDLEIEDHQVLIERMLQMLIERGRFDQAYEFARHARMLSIEYRQQLNEFITQAWRAPGSVAWSRDIQPRLAEARAHIQQRQEEDRRMQESVHQQLTQVEDVRARDQLIRLYDIMQSAGNIRARLQLEVSRAGDEFMDAQATAFRPRRPSGLPDLHTTLLPSIVQKDIDTLARHADDILLSLYPATIPKAPDLSDLIALLLQQRPTENTPQEEEPGELAPFRIYPPPFPEQLVEKIHQWLMDKAAQQPSWTIHQFLKQATKENFTAVERQCIVYALYRSFPQSETILPDMHCSRNGIFASDVARGDNLVFQRKEQT